MYKIIFWYSMFISNLAIADCKFSIINYTNHKVSAKVGFYGKVESSVIVLPLSNRIVKIKSEYKCKQASLAGLGLAYVVFPNDPTGAGANYSPINNQINLVGKFSGIKDGRPMVANNGSPIWLTSTGTAITDDKFEVKLIYVQRPNSLSAGT